MATMDYDAIASLVANEEYKNSPWYLEPHTFARSERRCVRVVQRGRDQSPDQTRHVLENALTYVMRDDRFGFYRKWEADFIRHMLGFTTFLEEKEFNDATQNCFKMCDVDNSLQVKMGKRFTALLRHKLDKYMYPNGTVALNVLFDRLNRDVNPTNQYQQGRGFASFLNGNNKQRFFLEIYVSDEWFVNRDVVPWQVFIGCTQGHTTKVVDPSSISHRLSAVELDCFGWIFHVTDARNVDSIKRDGLRRYGRDSLHFMYDNDGAIWIYSKRSRNSTTNAL